MAETELRPTWLEDDNEIPPYPVLRCPRCKKLFSDHGIHICEDTAKTWEKVNGRME
jgi:hypothetical protein